MTPKCVMGPLLRRWFCPIFCGTWLPISEVWNQDDRSKLFPQISKSSLPNAHYHFGQRLPSRSYTDNLIRITKYAKSLLRYIEREFMWVFSFGSSKHFVMHTKPN